MCRKVPFDTLMMLTTTISVSNVYSTSIVVIVPIIWLYMTVVVVVVSFSIIVSYIFISLLLITVGIIYSRPDNNISVVNIILFDGENISFEAKLVMYINNTSIPPIIIVNKMYENQNLLYIVPLIRHTIVVCISPIMSPIARGCFICVNINPVNVLSDISNFVMSGGILFKILMNILPGRIRIYNKQKVLMKWLIVFPLKF